MKMPSAFPDTIPKFIVSDYLFTDTAPQASVDVITISPELLNRILQQNNWCQAQKALIFTSRVRGRGIVFSVASVCLCVCLSVCALQAEPLDLRT